MRFVLRLRQLNLNNGHWHYWGWVNGEWVQPLVQANYDSPEKSDQSTCLSDGSTEIYRGDILNYKTIRMSPSGGFYLDPESFQPHLARMVDFRNGCFVLVDNEGYVARVWTGCYDLGSHLKDKKWEVIGNIYENPELLDGEG